MNRPEAPACGSVTATDFVAWYNGHPDQADATFDLSHRTAVVVGNGNVALDVARILVSDPEQLARARATATERFRHAPTDLPAMALLYDLCVARILSRDAATRPEAAP